MSTGWLFMILLLAGVSLSFGEVVRVPGDAPTIQMALDAIADGDTVLVEVGEYSEALHAPPLAFVLRGRVVPDTGDYPRPMVDPSRLPGSDALACLILPANSHPVIEDMTFRNGPAMYPRRSSGDWGGIRSASPDPILRRCCLDSVYLAFRQEVDSPDYVITLESCLFRHDSVMCVQSGWSQVHATDCLFSGHGFYLMSVASSRFVRCHFRDNNRGHLLVAYGRDIEISQCVFGPYGPYAFVAVEIDAIRGRMCDNLFTECQPGMGVLSVSTDTADGVLVQGNIFINNHVVMGQGFAGMSFGYRWDGDTSQSGMIQDNIFTACSTNTGTKGLSVSAPAQVIHNRFADLDPPSQPAVSVFNTDGVVLRNNLFERNGLGINTEDAGLVDARWNWWGDSTGPYHASLNPEGQGDEVQGNVEFIPWWADTSFLHTTPRGTPSPEAFDLQAYPNPFNDGLSIRFRVPGPGIFRVELFDVLGRRTTELRWGPVADAVEIKYDARTLSSGVYFIRATDTIFNRSVAMCKVVHLR
jgi:hypothetical protein